MDEEGRDVLSWIEGETFTERGRMHPYVGDPPVRVTFTDDQLRAAFHLLRRYHDAFGDDVVCHGDFGPWNLVWQNGLPVGLIDFDQAHRADPSEDVAYALADVRQLRLERGRAVRPRPANAASLDAYGCAFDVPGLLELEYGRVEERCRRHGWHRTLAKLPAERAWLEAHRGLF